MAGRNILIVGGRSGIGKHIADQVLAQGDHACITSRDVSQDMVGVDGSYEFFDAAAKDWSPVHLPDRLDGLVYCPGTINLKSFKRLSDEDFRNDWEINFMGAVRVIRATQNKIRKSKFGSSIVLFSTVAVQTGMSLHASVAAAKGAVEGLTRALAAEFSPEVRVNAIAPSLTATPLAASLLKSDNHIEAAKQRHPLKDIGDAADVASLAVHLLNDSSRWITGQIFAIDGGLSSVRTP